MARVVVVAQRKGGTGKSTVSLSLAAASGSVALRRAMVDLDSQGNASTWALGRAAVRGLRRELSAAMLQYPPARNWLPSGHELLDRNATPQDVLAYVEKHCTYPVPGVAGLSIAPLAPHVHIEDAQELLLRELPADWVIVDTGADTSSHPVRSALSQADEVVIPTLPDHFSIWGVEHVLREIAACGRADLIDDGHVRIVINGRQRCTLHDVAERDIREQFGALVSPLVVARAVAVSEAGVTPELLTKRNPIWKAAVQLWGEIQGHDKPKKRGAA